MITILSHPVFSFNGKIFITNKAVVSAYLYFLNIDKRGIVVFLKKIKIFFILVLLSNSTFASCFIEEIVELADDDYTLAEVKEECNSKVDESECRLSRIYNYAKKGARLSKILRNCDVEKQTNKSVPKPGFKSTTETDISLCITAYGSCQMDTIIPMGSSCYCPTNDEPIWGVAE